MYRKWLHVVDFASMSSYHLCAWSLLCDSLLTVPALISPQPPWWGPKISPLVGSAKRSNRIQAVLLETCEVSGDGSCVGAGRPEPMADGSLCPRSTSIHNLIMTFTSLIQPRSLTATHMPCSPTNSAILAGAKTQFLINQAPRGDAHWTQVWWGSHFLALCERGALSLLSATGVM